MSAWLTLRQAREAVANDRPDEAHRLLEPLLADGYHKAWKVAREVVAAYAARAKRYLDRPDPDAAWQELLAAEALNTGERVVTELRQALTKLGLSAVRTSLEAGRPGEAVETAARLRERAVRHPDLTRMEEAGQDWLIASEQADRGDFARALALLDRSREKVGGAAAGFDKFRAEVADRQQRFKDAAAKLYEAAEARHWRDALFWAEDALTAAPEHREVRTLQGKAWQAVHPETLAFAGAAAEDGTPPELGTPTRPTGEPRPWAEPAPQAAPRPPVTGLMAPVVSHRAAVARRSVAAAAPEPLPGVTGLSDPEPAAALPLPKRFYLWVDGVGGYLVCLSPRVTFGQATADGPVDVPLFADVSRLHAEITRDGEGYLLESAKGVLVNGKESARAVLAPDDRVTLGATCQFRFHKPVPASSTARLELTSGHRLPIAVDGVLLMGNELMLGPGPAAHVLLPEVPKPVLIYRSKDGLGVRVPGAAFRVDDRPYTDRAPLPLPAVVSADAFTFAVEPAGPRV
jgi:hypothetical protein